MYITTVLVVWLAVMVLRRRPSPALVRTVKALLGVLVLQILVGALNVWLEEYEAMIILHLGLGTLLWATSTVMTFQLFPVAEPSPAGRRAASREAVTA
jgi:heme A synthase